VTPRRRRALLGALTWILLVTAAARPQLIGDPIALPMEGRDLMLAVDISGSMAEQDMVIGDRVVERLTAVKAVAGDFIERRKGDRVGLILFGAQAYLQAPLTFDRETVRTLLFEAAVGLAGRETAIGDAIGLAVKRLREKDAENRILILLTDGANTAGSIDPIKAAELAAREGVRIYTIGVGSELRGPFGLRMGGSGIDEDTLQAIAKATGGRYFRARDVAGLQAIYGMLDELEPVVSDEQTFRPVQELFQWPLAAALLLSALLGLAVAGMASTLKGLIPPRHNASKDEVGLQPP
jgi:Ca-activated chloride channel family protein